MVCLFTTQVSRVVKKLLNKADMGLDLMSALLQLRA